MASENRPVHSPLGASSAERWMNCPGSIALLNAFSMPESDEEDWRRDGIAAHEASAKCLRDGLDAWEVVGEKFHGTAVEEEIGIAIQVYLDECRSIIDQHEDVQVFIEYGISSPKHEKFYGTLDFGAVFPTLRKMVILDYKHGEGIIVEIEDNPQILYYAYGLLREHPEVEIVDLGIVQPRGFHQLGSIRTWEVSADYIRDWVDKTLVPAMLRTEVDDQLDAGPWCRFCPAKLICPLLTSLFGAACNANPKNVVQLSDESLGRSYQYTQAVKFYLKAMEAEAFRRLNTGAKIKGIKLVPKKANRVFREGAPAEFKAKFGKEAYNPAELKSPAEMEKISPAAKTLVHEWAFTPQTGLTVALDDDKRPAVKVQTTAEAFPTALENA